MRVISFDQSTNKTGYSVFDNENLINHGVLDFSEIENSDERIFKLKTEANNLIKNQKAEIVAIEQIQYQGNLQGYKPLAELLGVMKNNLYEQELLYFIIEPSKWKSTCGVKGKKRVDQKANAQNFVKEQFDIDASEDEADAICIGWHMVQKEVKKVII